MAIGIGIMGAGTIVIGTVIIGGIATTGTGTTGIGIIGTIATGEAIRSRSRCSCNQNRRWLLADAFSSREPASTHDHDRRKPSLASDGLNGLQHCLRKSFCRVAAKLEEGKLQ